MSLNTKIDSNLNNRVKFRKLCKNTTNLLKTQIYTLKTTNKAEIESMKRDKIVTLMTTHQLRWAGHLIRMPDIHLPKQIVFSELACAAQRRRFIS